MEKDNVIVKMWLMDLFHRGLGRTASGGSETADSYVCDGMPQVITHGRWTQINAVIVDTETGDTHPETFILSGLPFSIRREECTLTPEAAERMGITEVA